MSVEVMAHRGVAMSYTEMFLPFETVTFEEMKKKQAEQYLVWYIDTLDERFCRLQNYISETGHSVVLDKTPESLIGLWEWFESKIELRRMTEAEIEEEIKMRPEWMAPHVLANPRRISSNTLTIAWDIAAYYGEVIVSNHPQISWGYVSKPKKLDGVNRPRLLGFEGDMSVYTYAQVEVCMWRSIKTPDKMRLYDMYKVCVDMI